MAWPKAGIAVKKTPLFTHWKKSYHAVRLSQLWRERIVFLALILLALEYYLQFLIPGNGAEYGVFSLAFFYAYTPLIVSAFVIICMRLIGFLIRRKGK